MNRPIWSGYRSFCTKSWEKMLRSETQNKNIGLVCIFHPKFRLSIITHYQCVFIINGVKIIDHHIRLWSPIKDTKNGHPRVVNFVSLKFKEYTKIWLYQIPLNCSKLYIDLSNTQYMLWFYVWGLGMWTPSRKLHNTKSSDHINICIHHIYQLSTAMIDAFVLPIKR